MSAATSEDLSIALPQATSQRAERGFHPLTRRADAVVLLTAALLSYLPVLLILGTGIWSPLSMIQEQFSHYYAARLVLSQGYYVVPTGHLFALYAYPAGIVADTLFAGMSQFARFQIFLVGFHLWNGTLTFAVLLIAYRLPLATTDRWLLLLAACGMTFLERYMTFGIGINYHTLEQLLMLVVAIGTIYYLFGERTPSPWAWMLLGAVAGVALGVKLTLLPILGPLLFLTAMPWRSGWLAVIRAAVTFGVALAVTYVCLMTMYFQFHLVYWPLFLAAMTTYFSGDNVSQSAPFLMAELTNWLHPRSYYFGFQILATCWVVMLLLSVWVGVRTRRLEVLAFLAANAPAIAVLSLQFVRRGTVGTMLDISLYLAFGIVTFGALLLRFGGGRRLVQGLTVAMLAGCVLAAVSADPVFVFSRLRTNSALGWQIAGIQASRPELPIIYYMSGFDQPLIFASADLYGVVGLAPHPTVELYRQAYYPRTRYVNPADGPIPEPHVAIIPEYLDLLPETPQTRIEWPQMWKRVDVLSGPGKMRDFVDQPEHACQVFQFVPQDMTRLYAFYGYATRVTVCVADHGS